METMTEDTRQPGMFREIIDEFRSVTSGRGRWLDSLLPPVVFVILNAIIGFNVALWGSLIVAFVIGIYRLFQRQPLRYAMGGIGGVILAMLVARLVGSAEGYFLPGIVSGVFTVLLCFLSVILKRPLVSWTSFIARRWPLEWYWHPRVRPAYSEATIAWGVFFAARTSLQFGLFQQQAAGTLGVVQLLTGWPAIFILLVASYLYGLWRLQNLKGPSVEEFQAGVEPPWQSQKRGF